MRVGGTAALVLLFAGCKTTVERAPTTWYEAAEIVCIDSRCAACRGTSAVGCGPCRATGDLPCTGCRDGTQKCAACDGDGRKSGKKCKTCDGKGRHACHRCGGDRLMECGTCSGKGKLTCLRPIPITETPPDGEDVWPPQPK